MLVARTNEIWNSSSNESYIIGRARAFSVNVEFLVERIEAIKAVFGHDGKIAVSATSCGRRDLVSRETRRMTMEHEISNGFSFGGVNASIIFRRWH